MSAAPTAAILVSALSEAIGRADAAPSAADRAAALWDAHQVAESVAAMLRRQAWRAEEIDLAERSERSAAE